MILHPEDMRYWIGWFVIWVIIMLLGRYWLVAPMLKRLDTLIDILRLR